MALRVILGRDQLIQLVTRNEFYPADSPFLPVGRTIASVQAAYLKSAESRCCGPDPAILFPALDLLMVLLQESAAARLAFRQFLAANKGYEIGVIAIYYRKGREPHPFKLEL